MDDVTLMMWVSCGLCVLFIGVDKAGFGGGIGMVATPLLSLVMPPTRAAAILLPLLCGADIVSLYVYRRVCSTKNLWALLPGAVLGIVLGAFFINRWQGDQDAAERELKAMVGWLSLIFVAYQTVRVWLLKRIEKYHPKGWHGWLLGSCTGFTSTLAHAGGPPVTMYLLPQHMDRQLFVGTTVWLFALINAIKLIPYCALGLFPKENLTLSLALMPLVPLGVGLGVWMNKVTNDRLFNRLIYGILFLTGLQLVTGWSLVDLFR